MQLSTVLLLVLALLTSFAEAFLPSSARYTVSSSRHVSIFNPSSFRSDFLRAAALMHSRASPSCTAGPAPSPMDPTCAVPIFVRAIPPALRHALSMGTTTTTFNPPSTCNASHLPLAGLASRLTFEFVTLLPSADTGLTAPGPQLLDSSTHLHMGQLCTSVVIGTAPSSLFSGASLTGTLAAWQPPTALASYGALGSGVYYGGLAIGVYVTYRGVTWLMTPRPQDTIHVIPPTSSTLEAAVSPPPPPRSNGTTRTLVFTPSIALPLHRIKGWVTSLNPSYFNVEETATATSQATAATVDDKGARAYSNALILVKSLLPQQSPAPPRRSSPPPAGAPSKQASEGSPETNTTRRHGRSSHQISTGYVHAEPVPNATCSRDTGFGFLPLHLTPATLAPVDWAALLHTGILFLVVLLATTPISDVFGLLYTRPPGRSCRYRMARQRRRLAKALRRISARRSAKQQACVELSHAIHSEFLPLFALLRSNPILKVDVEGRGPVYVGRLLIEKVLHWDSLWRPFAFPMTEAKREDSSEKRRVSFAEYNGRAAYPHDEVIQSLYVRFLREVMLCPALHDKLRLFVLLTSAYELLDLVLEKRFQIVTLEAHAFVRDSFFRNEARVQAELEWKARIEHRKTGLLQSSIIQGVRRLLKTLKASRSKAAPGQGRSPAQPSESLI